MSRAFRPLISKRVFYKIQELTKPHPNETYVINRNPRNLEKLRIAYKPTGYHLEKPGRSYWYILEVDVSSRYVTAELKHFEDGTVIKASTSEWALKEQLFKTKDTTAFINLGRVFAQRCLQAGILEMTCNIKPIENSKMDKLLKSIQENGVSFQEPERYTQPNPWDACKPEKPWQIDTKSQQEEHKREEEQKQISV